METRSQGPPGDARSTLLCAVAVAAPALLIYLPTLGYGFSNFDDPTYVADNPWIHALTWSNVRHWWTADYFGNYAPLTLASYALDHALWGQQPFGYHLTNVLLHAASSGLLVAALRLGGASLPTALFGAIVFATHPAQVESVAWVAQRKTLLAGFFLLLSYLAYVRAISSTPPSRGGLEITWGLFLAALVSKVTVVIFPAVLILYDLGFRRGESPRRLILEKVPFVILAAAGAWVGYRAQVDFQVTTQGWLGGTPVLHAATMAELLARYARILLLPTGLSALYDPPDARSLVEPWAVAGCALAALGAWGAWFAWRRDRRALPWMGFFWLGFLPVSQIVPYTVHMADRYLYVPMMGVAAVTGAGGVALLGRMRGRASRAAGAAAIGIALLCLSLLTLARERVWHDPFSLWSDTIRRPPVHWVSWYNHGKTMDEQGSPWEAIASYEQALALNPESVLSLTNLGHDYALVGELDRAESALRRAIALPRAVPEDRARAAILLGELLLARGRPAGAIPPLEHALAWQPRSVPARLLLARSLHALGRDTEARLRLDQALDLALRLGNPDSLRTQILEARKALSAPPAPPNPR